MTGKPNKTLLIINDLPHYLYQDLHQDELLNDQGQVRKALLGFVACLKLVLGGFR